MGRSETNLGALRKRIDELDERIVALLNERAAIVIRIGQSKRNTGESTYVPDREHDVLQRVASLNAGPLPQRTIHAIYRELMSGSLSLERAPRIAYLGPAGSFSHLAAARKFGASVDFHPLTHIEAVFDELQRGRVDLALVPIENSVGGGVVDTLDAFVERDVSICGELKLGVHHYLLGAGPLERVQKVYSKPEVFTQCQRWLTQTGMAQRTVPAASTSKAAELASQDDTAAAIGSLLAGELFNLPVLADRIEDDPDNVTRFLILGGAPARPTGDDKTAVYFRAADRPGALNEVLDAFRRAGVNMTFIQSRPTRQKGFDYGFFVDLQGHVEDESVARALDAAAASCTFFKVLGSFCRADEIL